MSATTRLPGIALLATSELTITVGGAITVTGFYHTVAANGGGADNLDTITNGYTTLTVAGSDYYPLVYLKGKSGDTITVRHGQDNIDLPNDTDFVLATDAWTPFIWDGSNYTTTKAATSADAGEANTASNQGVGGVGLYIQKTGVDLEFKNINAGSAKITVTNDAGNNEVDIDLGTVDFSDLNTKTHTHQDAANGGQLDHGLALTGLTDDDHTIYALLAGRAGGQILTAGTGSGDDLHLRTTSDVTKGAYFFDELTTTGRVYTPGASGNIAIMQDTYGASTDPTVNNDVDEGWIPGSIWVNTTSDIAWICLDNTDGAAVWIEITQASGGGLYESVAILRDEKATTTAGGGSAATTWNARDLNTEVYDPDGIVAIGSNQFTPVAGDYEIEVTASSWKTDRHRLRLYNVTGTATVEEGLNAASGSGDNVGVPASLKCVFTANGTDAYRIDHYTVAAQASNGLGFAVSDGSNEVYMTIVLRKLA